jgi:anti-sigma-K factor RskA
MSADSSRERPSDALARLDELLADRALVGLSAAEEAELAALLAESGAGVGPELELAAASLDLALASQAQALPAQLRTRLVSAARDLAAVAGERTPVRREARAPAPRGDLFAVAGWLAAAAACVLAVLAWRARAPAAPEPAERRTELLARPDTLRLEWAATELAPGASGDVAWSQALQQGVLRIQGLPANDPEREQFQLWIFDEDQQHPVDGGVFDVSGAEVLIPIDAKLRVARPTLFAVTREKPGGVVVSDQQRIVLVARI